MGLTGTLEVGPRTLGSLMSTILGGMLCYGIIFGIH
jgi:hypothetical protein